MEELYLKLVSSYRENPHYREIVHSTLEDWKRFEKTGNFSVFDLGVVYFIHIKNTAFYKIGISSSKANFFNRIKTFQTGVPWDVEIICASILEKGLSEPPITIEKFLHTFFKKNKKRGEWFEFNQNEVECIYDFLANELENMDFIDNEDYNFFNSDMR